MRICSLLNYNLKFQSKVNLYGFICTFGLPYSDCLSLGLVMSSFKCSLEGSLVILLTGRICLEEGAFRDY